MRSSIFGTRHDLAVFLVIPFLVAGAFGVINGTAAISPLAFLLLYVLFDHFHVYLGIGTALNFSTHTKGRALFYWGFPVACLAIYFAAFCASPAIFYSLFAYASLFHFGRQQIGWMRIASRRAPLGYPREFALNDAAIYASTFGFVLYRIAVQPGAKWFVDGDLGSLPSVLAPVVLTVVLAINAFYVGAQVVHRRKFNFTQNLIWLSTFLTWGVAFAVLRNYNVISLALIIVHHAAPFVLLSLKYARKRVRQDWQSRVRAVLPVLVLLALGAAFIEFAFSAEWIDFQAAREIGILEPLLATFSTYHYAIDSFFWREKYNPGCTRFVDDAPVPIETRRVW